MKNRHAFTLVELLVVISIIGILVALLLPAVQSARESGRKAVCNNNLKQLATAAMAHESAHGHYPTGGWAWYWAGDPDRGTGQRQPGGWSFNILPFMGEQPLHDLGIGLSPTSSQKRAAIAQAEATPLSVFYCPTRRQALAYPNPQYQTVNSSGLVTMAARTDYAANAGTYQTSASGQYMFWGAPTTGDPTFSDAPGYQFPFNGVGFDGIMYTLSMVSHNEVSDGATYTYMFGEKMMDPLHYTDGLEGTDNNPLYAGFDWDWSRWGALAGPNSAPLPPMHDQKVGANTAINFNPYGSAHVDGLNMFTCDGSGHWTSYAIDPQTFVFLCSRNDGQTISEAALGW